MAERQIELPEQEIALLKAVDDAIVRAGQLMDLEDLPEEMDEDERNAMWEDRFHCGKCVVRTVMETIWDDLSALMDYYEKMSPRETIAK